LMQKKVEVAWLSTRVIKKYALLTSQEIPETRMSLEELLKIYPLKDSSQFVRMLDFLEPIIPRLYSISSSPAAHEGEIHITVALNKFECDKGIKYGLCSDFISQFQAGRIIDFYIHSNSLFRLPENETDVIMIGPGTGIAPFRSFLYERDAIGATGRNWLFFGDQHFITDFLYQTEIQQWIDSGVLTQVDLAFSRDQEEKIYVQHKILKKGKQFYEWLENGAVIYICGSRDPMSRDVETAITEVIQLHGNKSNGEAIEYINTMKEEGRLLTDVY
jgi:sulfite reductase (NADPH) flavoprotein alpha-component